MKSKFLTIDYRDILKGIFIAFMTAILTGLLKMLEAGAAFDWPTIKPLLIAGACAAISYVLKNLLTNSNGQMFTREPV
jgi:hypothetical protein